MQYWMMKSEPVDYSIDDLEQDGTAPWDGIRNYQARNPRRDNMEVGDRILFYHSNTKQPGLVGVAEIAGRPYSDHTQFDPDAKYYDPPRTGTIHAGSWSTWDLLRSCQEMVSLPELRSYRELADLVLLIRARLSVQPVTEAHYTFILDRAREPAQG